MEQTETQHDEIPTETGVRAIRPTHASQKMIYVLRFRVHQHIVNLHVFDFVQHRSVRVRRGVS